VFNVASPSELKINPAMRRVRDTALQTQYDWSTKRCKRSMSGCVCAFRGCEWRITPCCWLLLWC